MSTSIIVKRDTTELQQLGTLLGLIRKIEEMTSEAKALALKLNHDAIFKQGLLKDSADTANIPQVIYQIVSVMVMMELMVKILNGVNTNDNATHKQYDNATHKQYDNATHKQEAQIPFEYSPEERLLIGMFGRRVSLKHFLSKDGTIAVNNAVTFIGTKQGTRAEKILRLHYGFEPRTVEEAQKGNHTYKARTLQEVSLFLGISKQRVYQIENKAISLLYRQSLRTLLKDNGDT